jgi:hypothetical protein
MCPSSTFNQDRKVKGPAGGGTLQSCLGKLVARPASNKPCCVDAAFPGGKPPSVLRREDDEREVSDGETSYQRDLNCSAHRVQVGCPSRSNNQGLLSQVRPRKRDVAKDATHALHGVDGERANARAEGESHANSDADRLGFPSRRALVDRISRGARDSADKNARRNRGKSSEQTASETESVRH